MEKLALKFRDGDCITVKVWETETGYLGNIIDTIGGSVGIGHVTEIATDNCVDGVLKTLGYGPDSGRVVSGRYVWK